VPPMAAPTRNLTFLTHCTNAMMCYAPVHRADSIADKRQACTLRDNRASSELPTAPSTLERTCVADRAVLRSRAFRTGKVAKCDTVCRTCALKSAVTSDYCPDMGGGPTESTDANQHRRSRSTSPMHCWKGRSNDGQRERRSRAS
jgi:hypothetical protein